MNPTLLSLISLVSISFTPAAIASDDPTVPDLNRARYFIEAVMMMDAIEATEPGASASLLDWLVPSANAQGTPCIVAGHIGAIVNGSCVTPNQNIRKGNQIQCNPEIFGELTIAPPSDGRWTRACGNAFLKGAGIKKRVDQELSAEETSTLASKLKEKKLPDAGVHEKLTALCKAAKASGRQRDIADCGVLENLYAKSLGTRPGGAKSIPGKTDPCIKTPERSITNLQNINEVMRRFLFQFNPSKHINCNAKKDDQYGYGIASVLTHQEYQDLLGKSENGKICYQKAFIDESTRHLVAAMNALEFKPEGSKTTVKIGICEVDIEYRGTDRSKYPKDLEHPDREYPVKVSFRTKHVLGAIHESSYSSDLGQISASQKEYLDGNRTNRKMFDETFRGSYQDYGGVLKSSDQSGYQNPNINLLMNIVPDTYLYCQSPKGT